MALWCLVDEATRRMSGTHYISRGPPVELPPSSGLFRSTDRDRGHWFVTAGPQQPLTSLRSHTRASLSRLPFQPSSLFTHNTTPEQATAVAGSSLHIVLGTLNLSIILHFHNAQFYGAVPELDSFTCSHFSLFSIHTSRYAQPSPIAIIY